MLFVLAFGYLVLSNRVYGNEFDNSCLKALMSLDESTQKDIDFVSSLQSNPAGVYLNLRKSALSNLAFKKSPSAKNSDFPFPPHLAIVEKVLHVLDIQLQQPFGKKHRRTLLRVKRQAQTLLIDGNPPYKKTIRYIFNQFLPALDLILAETHPEVASADFHQRHAKHLLEPMLAKAPDLLLYFSFSWVDDDFFVDTRPALMNAIGINLTGLDSKSDAPFADKYFMNFTDWSYHDLGHAEFTSFRDLKYLESEQKPIERTVWEWNVTRLRIQEVIEQVNARDPLLAEAMRTLLFELLRERGFQFSLTVLKQELETRKWTDVLKKKLKAGFYHYYGTNDAKFERLEEAREALVRAIVRFKEQDQLQWIKAIRSNIVPSKIYYTPPLRFIEGNLVQVEIRRDGPILVHALTPEHKEERAEIRELISAQVDPTKDSPMKSEIQKKIAMALNSPEVEAVLLKRDRTKWVRLLGGTERPLATYLTGVNSNRPLRAFEEIEVFEINQIFGAEERGEFQSFTVRVPTKIFVGTVVTQEDLITGHYQAEIKTLNGTTLTLPLSELRIDPL
jgi:hypothetical protein